ncbi:polyprenyl synthetase family protein [Ruminococcus sp. OA3]|uniref:polyprenyl synthetase family protein n=1 Tax=Ruminococcus sp. OA3 TaxID=2914164 RepID=UPI001F051884|nr:polyprenyl synthetase family protein [Ruminococcus sp. OA3]
MNFKEELKKRTEEARDMIFRFLPEEAGFTAPLAEAINYNMKAPGKRLRPILMRETCRMYGGSDKVVGPFMAAIEMIHTHSLIHDDLPALDNDDYRRGRKTTHVVYGEAMAVLSGDALLNYAYETALLTFQIPGAEVQAAKALAILAGKTGIRGMLGGQSVDVLNEGKPVSAEMLSYIYENKTSALIEASMMIGSVLAGAPDHEVARLEEAGRYIGLAFQIQDDILDVTGTQEELGKPLHSDEKNEKTTYVTLTGLDDAGEEVARLSLKAIMLLEENRKECGFLKALIEYLVTRTK